MKKKEDGDVKAKAAAAAAEAKAKAKALGGGEGRKLGRKAVEGEKKVGEGGEKGKAGPPCVAQDFSKISVEPEFSGEDVRPLEPGEEATAGDDDDDNNEDDDEDEAVEDAANAEGAVDDDVESRASSVKTVAAGRRKRGAVAEKKSASGTFFVRALQKAKRAIHDDVWRKQGEGNVRQGAAR